MPTMRELVMVLFRQRKVFVWVSGLVLGVALVYAFAGTKYQANLKVLVRRGRADARKVPRDLRRRLRTRDHHVPRRVRSPLTNDPASEEAPSYRGN